MDCSVELDSQRVIEAERAEVTAIDSPGVPPGRDPVPGPLGRRIPVGDVVMLARVIDPERGCVDHPILQPGRVAALQGRRRRILASRRAPRSELVKHSCAGTADSNCALFHGAAAKPASSSTTAWRNLSRYGDR